MLYAKIHYYEDTDETFQLEVGHSTAKNYVHLKTHTMPRNSNNQPDLKVMDALLWDAYCECEAKIDYFWPNAPQIEVRTLTLQELEAHYEKLRQEVANLPVQEGEPEHTEPPPCPSPIV
jgi:hypothetical protein